MAVLYLIRTKALVIVSFAVQSSFKRRDCFTLFAMTKPRIRSNFYTYSAANFKAKSTVSRNSITLIGLVK